MNTTSLEISKKLFKLSGWSDTEYGYYHVQPDNVWVDMPFLDVQNKDDRVSAYDLGYLLRKLPKRIEASVLDLYPTEHGWEAWYEPFRDTLASPARVEAATPEDAAALLAIKLFGEGILKRI